MCVHIVVVSCLFRVHITCLKAKVVPHRSPNGAHLNHSNCVIFMIYDFYVGVYSVTSKRSTLHDVHHSKTRVESLYRHTVEPDRFRIGDASATTPFKTSCCWERSIADHRSPNQLFLVPPSFICPPLSNGRHCHLLRVIPSLRTSPQDRSPLPPFSVVRMDGAVGAAGPPDAVSQLFDDAKPNARPRRVCLRTHYAPAKGGGDWRGFL